MRLLVSNDDGIDAPGLADLEGAARGLSDDVWVIAPGEKRSGGSHGITLHRPFSITRLDERRYSCSGTPVDCVIAAQTWLFAEGGRPGLVLAGINDGRNMAEDIAYSGTIAIAREAAFWGTPAIALSRPRGLGRYGAEAGGWLARLLEHLWAARAGWAAEGNWLSLNLPARVPAALREARIGRDKIAWRSEVIEASGPTTTLEIQGGRQGATLPGDEADLTGAGLVSVVRLNWFGQTALDGEILDGFPG